MIATGLDRIEAAPKGGGTPLRGLTRSLDLTKEKAMDQPTRTCTVQGCSQPRKTRLYCGMHKQRVDRLGSVHLPPKKERRCSVPGCDAKHYSKGYCKRHRQQVARCGHILAQPWKMEDDASRLSRLSKIMENGCIEYIGSRDSRSGYGKVRVGSRTDGTRRTARAHRVAWEIARGPIPEGHVVRHRCDNPPCVNPDHLELGTQADNVQDMVDRGRHWRHQTKPER